MTIQEAIVEINLAAQGKALDVKLDVVSELSDWLTKMVSGEGHKDWVRNVRAKETEREKEHRVEVYRSATKSTIAPIQTTYRKIYRADGIRETIIGNGQNEVRAAITDFHGRQTLFDYLERRQPIVEFSDPNAYLIIGSEAVRNQLGGVEEIKIFPIEVPGSEIVRSKRHRGLTQWIIRRQLVATDDGDRREFTLYTAGLTVTAREYGAKDATPVTTTDQTQYILFGSDSFAVTPYFNENVTEFPGIRWGAYDAPDADYCVSPLDPASDLLNEMVRVKAIYDVAVDNHVRPHRYEYDDGCDYQAPSGKVCGGRGYLNANDVLMPGEEAEPCPRCSGKSRGRKTEANVTRVKFPDKHAKANEIFKLSDLYHYEVTPLDTVNKLEERLVNLALQIPYAIFSSQQEQTPTGTSTATEILVEADEKNNRVYPAAAQFSRIYEKVCRLAAMYLGVEVEVSHAFPENLRLENLTDLLKRLKEARDAGASLEAIFSLQCEITEKTNRDLSTVENMKAFERHRPWRSLSDTLVAAIRMDRAPTDPDRMLYENFDRVKTEVLEAHPGFYLADYSRQRQLIDAQLVEIAGTVVIAAAGANFPDLEL